MVSSEIYQGTNIHFCITITILDIIHRPLLYLKHAFSDTGFSLRLQIDPTQMEGRDRASLCLRTPQTTTTGFSPTYWAQLSMLHKKTETKSSLRNAEFQVKDRTMENVQNSQTCFKLYQVVSSQA
jgi:hypothetical protein